MKTANADALSNRATLEGLLRQYAKAKKPTFKMQYRDVALSFPGGPHPSAQDPKIQLIHWNELDPWATALGWKVRAESPLPLSDIIFELSS
jgi:hypothetical protein